jgi:EthD domain-containing protein
VTEQNVYFVLLTRRPELTREQFLQTWLGEHRGLIAELPGLVRASQLPVAEPEPGGPDGVGLLYFRTGADLKTALASPASARLRAHTQTFARSAEAVRLLLSDETAG